MDGLGDLREQGRHALGNEQLEGLSRLLVRVLELELVLHLENVLGVGGDIGYVGVLHQLHRRGSLSSVARSARPLNAACRSVLGRGSR